MMVHTILEVTKFIFIIAIAVFFLLEFLSPFIQRRLGIDFPVENQGISLLHKTCP